MAKAELTLYVKAKNMLAGGLESASKALKSFGSGVLKVGKWVATGFVAASTAIVAAAYQAQEFNKKISQISTLSNLPIRTLKKEVISLSAEFGLAKDEVTKGLYDALSAGVPEDNVFDFMRTASKMAIGGASSTAEAVDLLTTALNSFKIPAEDAGKVSDALFTTVKLGKTTVAELAASFAQVAPLASASGVKIEEMLAAVATLTKQGTPTAQAMTQIRAAIAAMNEELGDGWTQTMTLQQGFEAMQQKSGGSTDALKKLTGRLEGTLAILGTTGKNAAGAAADIAAMSASSGEAEKAFGKMKDANPFDKLKQSINGAMLSAGDAALTLLAPTIIEAAEAVKKFGENVANWMNSDKFKEIQTTVENIISAMMKGGDSRANVGKALVDVVIAGFAVAAEGAVNIILAAAPTIGAMLAAAAKIAWEGLFGGGSSSAERNEARGQLGLADEKRWGVRITGTKEEETAIAAEKRAIEEKVEAQVKLNRQKKIYSDLGIESGKVLEGETEAQTKLNTAVDVLVKTAAKYKTVVETTPPLPVPDAGEIITQGQEVIDAIVELTEEELAAIEEKNNRKAELAQEAADLEVEIEQEKNRLLEEETKKRWQDTLAENKKELAEAQELAGKRVDAVIAEARADKEREKGFADDDKKKARLESFLKNAGSNLSKRDQEWLDAKNKIDAAKGKIPGLKTELEVAESNLAEITKQTTLLTSLETELKEIKTSQAKLLAMG